MIQKLLVLFITLVLQIYPQVQLKVMTYNIMGMKPGTDPSTRLYYIIQNLKVLNPDIIGLQEINESLISGGSDNQAKTIADSLSAHFGIPYYHYYSQTHLSWNNQYKEFIGIITKHPVEQQDFYQLVAGAFPRKILWNLINTPLGKINFFNTHFDYQTSSVRLQQAAQSISFITQKENQFTSIGTILTGDFNDTPGSAPIDYILNAGFGDSFAQANPGIPGFTVPANALASKIDFIFNRNQTQLVVDTSFIIMNQPYFASSFCSDHLGVMTIFSAAPSSIDDEIYDQKKFELNQNYPNPFNPSTTLRYAIPLLGGDERGGLVTLKVYDILGNEIATLVNEEKPPGTYEVTWNAANLPSGVYFYQLKAGELVETKMMILLR